MKEFLSISEFSVVTSGTATLESAILGCPPIICYKTNFLNYAIISRMLKVDNIGLPNLLLQKRYFSELLQNECTKESIYNASRNISLLKENSENIANTLKAKLQGVGFENAAKELFLI
jgi:lipid-A-disaccharide synthase